MPPSLAEYFKQSDRNFTSLREFDFACVRKDVDPPVTHHRDKVPQKKGRSGYQKPGVCSHCACMTSCFTVQSSSCRIYGVTFWAGEWISFT